MRKPYAQKDGDHFLLRCECGRQVKVAHAQLWVKTARGAFERLQDVGMRLVHGVYRSQPYRNRR